MRLAGGSGVFTRDQRNRGAGVVEFPTFTCVHCNTVVIMNPERRRTRGHCGRCNAMICDSPVCHANCSPMQRRLELAAMGITNPDATDPLFGKQIFQGISIK